MLEGLIGSIIGAIIVLIGVRYNYIDLYNKTVTSSRIDSLKIIRSNISKIVSIISVGIEEKNINELFESIYLIKLCLSRYQEREGNEYHYLLEEKLNYIISLCNEKKKKENLKKEKIVIGPKTINKIVEYSRFIFDTEWSRVKKESKRGGMIC